MCILLNVKKHEKTFALNVDIFIVSKLYKSRWKIKAEGGTIRTDTVKK